LHVQLAIVLKSISISLSEGALLEDSITSIQKGIVYIFGSLDIIIEFGDLPFKFI